MEPFYFQEELFIYSSSYLRCIYCFLMIKHCLNLQDNSLCPEALNVVMINMKMGLLVNRGCERLTKNINFCYIIHEL